MNRHFTDARYYARRTASELARGVRTELQPAESRARSLVGRERREPTRVERARDRLRNAARRRADATRDRVPVATPGKRKS